MPTTEVEEVIDIGTTTSVYAEDIQESSHCLEREPGASNDITHSTLESAYYRPTKQHVPSNTSKKGNLKYTTIQTWPIWALKKIKLVITS